MINALRSSRHSAGMAGATTSSAASAMSKKSMPVLTPILSKTPISASTGALPAPAPNRRHEPSICLAPARTASPEFATPRRRVSCPREAKACQPQLAPNPEVLMQASAVGKVVGDPADRAAVVLRLFDVFLRADAG